MGNYAGKAWFAAGNAAVNTNAWRLLFTGRIAVRVPTAAFQFERTQGHDFFGLMIALGAVYFFGAEFDQSLGYMAAFTFKFIHWHRLPRIAVC